MPSTLCLRCDWSGDTRASTCPRCGAKLFDRPSADPDPTPERSWRGWIATTIVLVVAVAAFVTIQRFTPSAPPPTTGLDGYLVYAGGTRDQVRLWVWNLSTDTIQPGPVLPATPSAIVSLYAVEDSWVGLTLPEAHGAGARVVRSADASAQPVTIAHGGSVAWQDGGLFVSSTRSDRTHGCFRRVVVGTLSLSDRIGRHTSPFLLCGKVAGLFRDSLSPYLETSRHGHFQIWRVFADQLSPLLSGYEPLGASQNGDFLVRSSRGRAGMYYPSSTPGENKPVMIALHGNPLLVTTLLTWSVDGNVAYVLGSIGGVEGVFAVTVGPRREPGAPSLVVRTSATDVAASITVTNDVCVMAEGTLRFVHDGAVTSVLSPPAGAPAPEGPLLWVLSLPYSPSVTP
jgi:hypothetical protein